MPQDPSTCCTKVMSTPQLVSASRSLRAEGMCADGLSAGTYYDIFTVLGLRQDGQRC